MLYVQLATSRKVEGVQVRVIIINVPFIIAIFVISTIV